MNSGNYALTHYTCVSGKITSAHIILNNNYMKQCYCNLEEKTQIIIHELGHVLGLRDYGIDSNKNVIEKEKCLIKITIMYYQVGEETYNGTTFTELDVANIKYGYGGSYK